MKFTDNKQLLELLFLVFSIIFAMVLNFLAAVYRIIKEYKEEEKERKRYNHSQNENMKNADGDGGVTNSNGGV